MKTNAAGSESTPNLKKIIKLEKDWPAPFSGRLMPDETFRFYVNTRDESEITRRALKDCQSDATKSGGNVFATAVGSFIVGVLAAYYFKN